MDRLVLFDIDGTLLSAAGAAAPPFREALETVFGTAGPLEGYSFAGRTDPEIATDLLTSAGLAADEIAAGLERVWELYLTGLELSLRTAAVRVLPGIPRLLDTLHEHPGVVLGLLTGNLREGARLKIEAAGLGFDRFLVGAFGSDHAQRPELPAIAVRRAEERLGRRFDGQEVVIIGDTPRDIACGAHLGVRTIAVATGSYSRGELAECGPHAVFDTLERTEEVVEGILRR